jgi:hypothetical protein
MKQLLNSRAQTARALGIDPRTLEHLISTGAIRTISTGGKHPKIPTVAIEDFLAGRTGVAASDTIKLKDQNQIIEPKTKGTE